MEPEGEEVSVLNYEQITDNLINATDEMIISDYLNKMINSEGSWGDYFFDGEDVYKEDPRETCVTMTPTFFRVEPQTEACGRIDGCETGCWRIIGRDKLIRNEDTGKFLGLKRILKFCRKTEPREYKRSWVMEEYRVPSKWNSKQGHVIFKIRLLFHRDISFLLAKHFSYSSNTPPTQSLPAYGVILDDTQASAYYLQMLIDSGGDIWPEEVTNDVYCMHPLALVDPQDRDFLISGLCIFANRTEASGYTDGCDSGCWRIVEPDSRILGFMGFKRVFRFHEKEENDGVWTGMMGTWTMEEYRLAVEVLKNKAICVIKYEGILLIQ